MKILLVTPYGERCGNATYSENLVKGLLTYDPTLVVTVALSGYAPIPMSSDAYDLVHFNYVNGMSLHPDWLGAIPLSPCKKVLTLQETYPGGNRSAFTDAFDAVIVHHKEVVLEASNFKYIPHGIPEVPGDPPEPKDLVVGSAGFPQPFKGHVNICHAVSLIPEAKAYFVMPESRHADAIAVADACRSILGDRLTVVHDWLPDVEVVKLLRANASVFVTGHVDWSPGSRGCARLGIAAKLPVIVPDYWHFRDIRDHVYLQDVYGSQDLAAMILLAHQERKDCWTQLISEMSWTVTSRMYHSLYEEVLAQ